MAKNRIVEMIRVPGKEILPAPWNHRTHPNEQREMLHEVVDEVGRAGVILAFRRSLDNRLVAIDGNLRIEEFPDEDWDVAVTDCTEAEAKQLNLTYDPLASLAEVDTGRLNDLLNEARVESDLLNTWFEDMREEHGLAELLLETQPTDAEYVENPFEAKVAAREARAARDVNEEDRLDAEDGEQPIRVSTSANLRMFQVFVDDNDYPALIAIIRELGKRWHLTSLSETVIRAIREAVGVRDTVASEDLQGGDGLEDREGARA